ncbi:FMN-dependent NADH-azoreductase [Achromobacter veterisilvae]|uniref:FMN dependent NADH:quinone oxidoreductase n=1 Tax=Achromobacter veterisilvae TaxID=2069367 RepID=A0A446CXS9_9BURK|nr:NAD(P)H-dependent oxidoreductase [Achromobacter veterisilvae]SSW72678.1 FMN-dependent NADH-azoreductase [Achromobacter veterisilvae]
MTILRIICSPRGRASESYRLSQRIVERIAGAADGAAPSVTELDATALPHVDPDYAATLSAPQDPPDEVLGRGALRQSAELIRSLRDASHIVIATPMHNFTVPSSLKAWIDHVVRVRHTFRITAEGKLGSLSDRPVYVAISSGGEFSESGAQRQPDFLTPYLRHVLGTIGLADVTFFSVQGTARGPAALEAARAKAEADIAAHAFGARAIAA